MEDYVEPGLGRSGGSGRGDAAPGVGLVVDNVGTEGHPPPLDCVPVGSRVLSKGGLGDSPPSSAPFPTGAGNSEPGEDDVPSIWRFSKPWPQ